MYRRNANSASETLVHMEFMLDLRVLCVNGLELDGNVVFGNNVDSVINDTCVTLSKSYRISN